MADALMTTIADMVLQNAEGWDKEPHLLTEILDRIGIADPGETAKEILEDLRQGGPLRDAETLSRFLARNSSRTTFGTVFERWKEYEKIAIHFNELLIKLRTRALGGIAAVVSVGGLVTQSNADQFTAQPIAAWGTVTTVLVVLLGAWAALWWVDTRYYSRLLLGAVAGILEIEDESCGKLKLSTRIEEKVVGRRHQPFDYEGSWWDRQSGLVGQRRYYASPFVVLALAAVGSTIMLLRAAGFLF